ncbi:flagellar biosynthesis anti-sigma factor FlgM [Parasphingorhabdus sp. JC815]|uniref:flagellar biosynthesis anti-sigma factor FlgM n=1 Tax=Parasphingorhabdus sp. JC815 TaxID=3232140 RepID=UPI00345B0EC4
MKPVESYSAINTRLDRPAVKEGATHDGTARNIGAGPDVASMKETPSITTTASVLAEKTPPFDIQKVADVRERIAAGTYKVDSDALAQKMLDRGVFGMGSD